LNSEEKRKERVKKEIQNLESLLNEIQLKDSVSIFFLKKINSTWESPSNSFFKFFSVLLCIKNILLAIY